MALRKTWRQGTGGGRGSRRQMVGDVEGALRFLRAMPNCSGKVGCFGTCSGGRHTVIAASNLNFDAAIDCWGGRVVMAPSELNPKNPVAPIDLTKDLKCPLLGIFGNEDRLRLRNR